MGTGLTNWTYFDIINNYNSQNFVYRMGTIALETGTLIYAWTLMTTCC